MAESQVTLVFMLPLGNGRLGKMHKSSSRWAKPLFEGLLGQVKKCFLMLNFYIIIIIYDNYII